MKFKSLRQFVLILLTAIMGAVPYLEAHAADLIPTIVITDDWVHQKQEIICGKAETTSKNCQDAFRNCAAGVDRIMDNAYSVCNQQPSECKIIDVTTTHFSQTAYNLLVRTPIDNFATSSEAAILKSCNAQPQVASTPRDPTEVERRRQEAMNAEAGIVPAPIEAEAAPAANANNVEVAEPVAPAAIANNDQAAAPAAPKQESAGGCSLESGHDSFTLSQMVLAVFSLLIAFGAIKFRQSIRV
ncbi:MAG: hypothetical protein K8R69_00740 [Deltaproteobacteria bacterium]|nr:hypothetical protein [Deltaproteobacteria bacterium]